MVVNLIFTINTESARTCSSTWLGLSSEQDGPLVLHVGSHIWADAYTLYRSHVTPLPFKLSH